LEVDAFAMIASFPVRLWFGEEPFLSVLPGEIAFPQEVI
jgi:hypothetical protein